MTCKSTSLLIVLLSLSAASLLQAGRLKRQQFYSRANFVQDEP